MNPAPGPAESKTPLGQRLRRRRAVVATGVLLVLVAASLVVVVAAGPGFSAEQPPEVLDNHGATESTQFIRPGDSVSVDVTTLLNGKVWKTTQLYIAELLQLRLSGNLTGFNSSIFKPAVLPAGEEVQNNPVLTALARELPGRKVGDHLELAVVEPFGPASEVRQVDLPRWWGPFPRDTTWTPEAFTASFGAPQLGMSVATNKLFNSTVTAVDATRIITTSEAQAGETVALPFFNSFLRVFDGDGNNLKFRVDPVQNVSFSVQEGRTYFGLAAGHYAVANITEETISYLHHPKWSPYLVGLSFDLVVDIRPSDYAWAPIISPTKESLAAES